MKELDQATLMSIFTECQIAYDICMQKIRELEDLHITATDYYNQAEVHEYIIIKLIKSLS